MEWRLANATEPSKLDSLPAREVDMRIFVLGLLTMFSLPAVANGLLDENHTNRNYILIDCDKNAARLCQFQANGCFDICKVSNNVKNCNDGCLDRYKDCKVTAGCGNY